LLLALGNQWRKCRGSPSTHRGQPTVWGSMGLMSSASASIRWPQLVRRQR